MSAERLREAAALMRKGMPYEHMAGHIDDRDLKTWLAVADWLDEVALSADARLKAVRVNTADDIVVSSRALAVANAYLGGAA